MKSLAIGVVLSVSEAVAVVFAGALAEWAPGKTTWVPYESWQPEGGNCMFGAVKTDSFPNGFVVAINTPMYNVSNACGHCFEVHCVDDWSHNDPNCCKANTSVIIQVTDRNTKTIPNLLDISSWAFDEIADKGCGVIESRYRRTDCDYGDDNLIWHASTSISKWWYAVIIKYANGYGHVSKVQIREPDTDNWIDGERQQHNEWYFEGPPNSYWHLPLDARVVGVSGEEPITSLALITNFDDSTDWQMSGNFKRHSDSGSATTDAPLTTDTNPTDETTEAPMTTNTATTRDSQASELPKATAQLFALFAGLCMAFI